MVWSQPRSGWAGLALLGLFLFFNVCVAEVKGE